MIKEEDLRRYKANVNRLFIIQERLDNQIRDKICLKCLGEQKKKRGCVNHRGQAFCKLLVKKRKKIMGKYWIYNLVNYSPYYKEILKKLGGEEK